MALPSNNKGDNCYSLDMGGGGGNTILHMPETLRCPKLRKSQTLGLTSVRLKFFCAKNRQLSLEEKTIKTKQV